MLLKMFRIRFACVISILFVSIVHFSWSQNRNLCDLCECSPSHVEPSYVNCNCKKNKVLIFKDEDGETLSNTKVLNISTCSFVSFPTAGFPKSKKLKSLQIRQMNLFHLNSAVFPSVSNVAIDDVSELIIDGFQGQNNLLNIEIKNSVLSDLNEDTFKDVKSLERLLFQNVSINKILPNSLHIANTPKLAVKFMNCKIDTIHSEAVSLQLSKLEFMNSVINQIDLDGLNVSAGDTIDVVRCTFGPILLPESLKLRAAKVNFIENEFKSLPTNLLRDVYVFNDKKINFVGNTIHDIDLGGFLFSSKTEKLNFVKNKIVCDCSPRKTSILRLKELFPGLLTNENNFDSIIDSNSCKNYNGIYLSEFKRRFISGLICNETDNKLLDAYSSEQTEQFTNIWQSSTESLEVQNSSFMLTSCLSLFLVLTLSNVLHCYL